MGNSKVFTLSSEPGDVPVCARGYSAAVAGQTLSGRWRSQATAITHLPSLNDLDTIPRNGEGEKLNVGG